MITRIWRGRTTRERAFSYGEFLRRTAYPDYGGAAGNRGWMLLRRDREAEVEFAFVSFWESLEALRRYAGPDPEQPKYYAEDRGALFALPEQAELYETVDVQLPVPGTPPPRQP